MAVNVPLAVVFAATTKSPVRVVFPLTVKSLSKVVFSVTVSVEFKVVAVAVTLKSVVMLVTFVPSDCNPKFSTQALPFQRKVVLVCVPVSGA